MSRISRVGWSGLGIGFLAILACEIPLIAVFLGVGGLALLDVPKAVEIVGILVTALSAAFLIYGKYRDKRENV